MKKLYLIITPDDKAALYRATQQEIHESDFPFKKVFEIEASPANSIKAEGNKLTIDLGTITVRELGEGGYKPMEERGIYDS